MFVVKKWRRSIGATKTISRTVYIIHLTLHFNLKISVFDYS